MGTCSRQLRLSTAAPAAFTFTQELQFMLTRTMRPLFAAAFIATAAIAAPAPAQPPSTSASLTKLVGEKAPAIVSLKFILKGEGGEQERDTTGVLIESGGLVLASNADFGGLASRFGQSVPTATDIKVLVGDDTQGVAAKIIARDTELGLAWVQVEAAPATPYAFVDFASASTPSIGDDIYRVSLMGKFFGRSPMVAKGHVGAIVTKPRKMFIPSIGLAGGGMGIPIFDVTGRAVGITTVILPDEEEMQGSMSDVEAAMQFGGMILPASEVVEATKRAKELVASGKGEPEPVAEPVEPAGEPGAAPGAEPGSPATPPTEPATPPATPK